jgi:hypothetical protein
VVLPRPRARIRPTDGCRRFGVTRMSTGRIRTRLVIRKATPAMRSQSADRFEPLRHAYAVVAHASRQIRAGGDWRAGTRPRFLEDPEDVSPHPNAAMVRLPNLTCGLQQEAAYHSGGRGCIDSDAASLECSAAPCRWVCAIPGAASLRYHLLANGPEATRKPRELPSREFGGCPRRTAYWQYVAGSPQPPPRFTR